MATTLRWVINQFGGLNARDPSNILFARSNRQTEDGWAAVAGIESPDLLNIDFDQTGIRKRLGSSLDVNLRLVFDATTTVDSDSAAGQTVLNVTATTGLIAGRVLTVGRGTAREEDLIISSISAGVSITATTNLAFAHTAVQADAVEQMVLLNGDTLLGGREWRSPVTNLRIQVLCSAKTIYVDQSGAFRQANTSAGTPYAHAATATKCGFTELAGHLHIGPDGANKIQVYRNSADLDPAMDNGNLYTEAFGGGTQIITGTWGTGYYILGNYQDRLLFGNGDSVIEFSDTSQAWDRAGGGFIQGRGAVRAIATLTPQFSDSLAAALYVLAVGGADVITALPVVAGAIQRLDNVPAPMNHACVVQTQNWLMYLSQEKTIIGINGAHVINIGRRMQSGASSGPLESIYATEALTDAFGFYDQAKAAALWMAPNGSLTDNSDAYVLDMRQGEPLPGEPEPSYEQRVRCLRWQIASGSAWFVHMYRRLGQTVGIVSTGKLYATESGNNDLASVAIAGRWRSPDFHAGLPTVNKQWLALLCRGMPTGNWSVTARYHQDRSEATFGDTWAYSQDGGTSVFGTAVFGTGTFASTATIKGSDDTDLYSEMLAFTLDNLTASETMRLTDAELHYLIGAQER